LSEYSALIIFDQKIFRPKHVKNKKQKKKITDNKKRGGKISGSRVKLTLELKLVQSGVLVSMDRVGGHRM